MISRRHVLTADRRRSSPVAAFAWAILVAALGPAGAASRAGGDELGRHEVMDYGQFLAATIKAPSPLDNTAMKGVAIKVGAGLDRPAAVCFDSDLLRCSAGWSGGFLKLRGTPFDGAQGSYPEVDGAQQFGTRPSPGWAGPDGRLDDPRPSRQGPLPRGWARYRGLYRIGDRVVLAYTVGDAPVLEQPWARGDGDGPVVFTRTFNVGPHAGPLTLVALDAVPGGTDGGVGPPGRGWPASASGPAEGRVAVLTRRDRATFAGCVGDLGGASWSIVDAKTRLLLALPPSKVPRAFRLAIATGSRGDLGRFADRLARDAEPLDLARYLNGGPSRWPRTVATRGTLGQGDGAFVVDTLTAPDDNPYRSWIRFGGMDFFADGRSAALSTWNGDVWVVTGVDATLERLTWRRFATGLHQPLGLKIVDETVHVLGRDGITRLLDIDGDGEADRYEAFNHDVAVSAAYHEFALDLQVDPEGNFYFAKAGPVRAGGRGFGPASSNAGAILKVSRDGSSLANYATGFRAPNGIGVGPDGQVTSGDNEGTWMPRCRLNWVRPGGFSGVVDLAHRDRPPTEYDEPICWLPKDVDNSSGGQAWVTSEKWGPFGGRLLHTSYGTCSLFLVLLDREGDRVQGGVVRFPLRFLSGIMRPRFNPVDGQLYVAGLRGWQTGAAADACFQRVRYTGKPANMVTGLKVIEGGLELTVTDPLDPEDAADPDRYAIERCNYLWTSEYGSDEYSTTTPDFAGKVRELNRLRLDPAGNQEAIEVLTRSLAKGRDVVTVESARLSADGKTVTLGIKDLRPAMQMRIRGRLKAKAGGVVPLDLVHSINFLR